jgi:4-hydroxy-4-methyl-2-oxoglutarate aldolase
MDGVSASLLERWRCVPTAIIADLSNGTCQIDPDIRPLRGAGQQPKLCGRALTAQCSPPDFGAVVRALEVADAGQVLVIAAQAHRATAMIGSILGGYLRGRGVAGIVCDGAIRDIEELAAWQDFSVFTRFVTPRGPTSSSHGEVNGSVVVGGRQIAPGDIVIGDDDGLVSLTPQQAVGMIEAAETKLALEKQWRQRLAAGMSVTQALAMPFGGDAP